MEQALVTGDLAGLDPDARLTYYIKVCESLGLNPLTRPFDYLMLNGKTILYARKDATDQLRKIHKVSITRLEREQIGDLLVVTASAATPDGRQDSAIGAVNVKGLGGEALANALMKAETKSKRRVTLSLCGLGMTDESEVESIPGAYYPEAIDPPSMSTREREVDDRDMVRRGDDRIWQRWLQLVVDANQLGLPTPQLTLPVDRNLLKSAGTELVTMIAERQAQVDRDAAEDAELARTWRASSPPEQAPAF